MYEKILVPLDGSELAEVALPYAENLAATVGSEITLIHVREEAHSEHENMHRLYIEKMVEVTQKGAEVFSGLPDRKAIKVKSVIVDGNPAEQIVDYADRENIGVIVMATSGRSGITRWVMGSVADKVLRATERPVALIRAETARSYVRGESGQAKLVVPLDGTKESETILPYVKDLATSIGGEVVLLHVVALAQRPIAAPSESVISPSMEAVTPFTPGEIEPLKEKAQAYLDKVCDKLKGQGFQTRCELRLGRVAEEIIRFASEIDADAVVMATHGRSSIGRLTIGSSADKVLREGTTPVVLVKA